jgi:hypothetical protein
MLNIRKPNSNNAFSETKYCKKQNKNPLIAGFFLSKQHLYLIYYLSKGYYA